MLRFRHHVPDNAPCCCGLLNLMSVFYFSSPKQKLFPMYPLAVLSHAQPRFTYNPIIHIMHPRKLRACAEPRRAAARRGEDRLYVVLGVLFNRVSYTNTTLLINSWLRLVSPIIAVYMTAINWWNSPNLTKQIALVQETTQCYFVQPLRKKVLWSLVLQVFVILRGCSGHN